MILLLFIAYNYNVYIYNNQFRILNTNSSGSSQCDPELAIPDIFWDKETNPLFQAIGSENSVCQYIKHITRRDLGSSKITKVIQKYMKCGVLLKQVF